MAERIFLTGSGGLLGGHVLPALAELAPQAEVIRNTADLTDLSAVSAEVEAAGEIDLVIHLAALVPVSDVDRDPARGFAVNAAGTINLLAALSGSPARLVYCSTGLVYASRSTPVPEDAETDPVSIYGKSKLLGETAAREICSASGRPLCIARLFSIHDANQTGSFLRPSLERRIAEADPAAPFELSGADSTRDFLTAKDAGHLLARLALSGAQGVVNLASGRPVTVAEFAQSLAPFPLRIVAKGQPNSLVADTSRLRAILGENND
jgi:nucleoside-diphosphate-sugar epimerase